LCQSFGSLNLAGAPGTLVKAPTDGTITSWSMIGRNPTPGMHLIVYRPQASGKLLGVAVSSIGMVDGSPNSTSLGISVGDVPGISTSKKVTFKEEGPYGVATATMPGAAWAETGAYLEGQATLPEPAVTGQQLLYNATVELLPPEVSAITPTSGVGGTVVTISGRHLAVARSVSFGSDPASAFSGDDEHVTAVAPPRLEGGTVDVRVTTAGGTSAATPVDRFTFPSLIATLPGQAPADHTPPSIGSLSLTPTSFRAANIGASTIASRVGTRVSESLSEAATTTFTVQRVLAGRRSGKRCVAPSRGNRGKRRCTRLKAMSGSFTRAGAAGLNSFTFAGRVRNRALSPGSYRLVAIAQDPAGNRSKSAARGFTIIR
jgi:hypothetical protein